MGQKLESLLWRKGNTVAIGHVSHSGKPPEYQEFHHHSIMYRNAILGNLAGAMCISLIFLSPSASCAAEHMPWPAAEVQGSDK